MLTRDEKYFGKKVFLASIKIVSESILKYKIKYSEDTVKIENKILFCIFKIEILF